MEDTDSGSDIVCALREAEEEVGLSSKNNHHRVVPVCTFPGAESINGLTVTPVVAHILMNNKSKSNTDASKEDSSNARTDNHKESSSWFSVDDLTLCPREVESAFVMPLRVFLEPHQTEEMGFQGRPYVMRTYYHTFRGREYKISGLTAHICHQVARIALLEPRCISSL